MKINFKKGLLTCARYISSPHCDLRPENTAIDLLVIHNISLPPAEFNNEHIENFFLGKLDHTAHSYFASIKTLKVSSHLLIKRTGEIIQFVPFHKRAWHAGQSSFAGRMGCNDFSIGIELEGTDDLAYEKIQYEKLAETIKALQQVYPEMTRDRLVGHADIAPGRKTDPGKAFDWHYLDCLLTPERIEFSDQHLYPRKG